MKNFSISKHIRKLLERIGIKPIDSEFAKPTPVDPTPVKPNIPDIEPPKPVKPPKVDK